jgi:hypothetical protein
MGMPLDQQTYSVGVLGVGIGVAVGCHWGVGLG